ncbi:MAG: hypothetical protein V8R51_08150 [Clostridia bacterium]
MFQFESQGMTNFMKELKPDCLEDLIAGVHYIVQDQWIKYQDI